MRSKFFGANLLVVLLAFAYTLPGLVGHDPWKQDEAYVFDITWHMAQSGDYVVPTLAGEPFLEKPPLYYYTAGLAMRAFDGWLPPHDAARLASGLFVLIALACIWLSGRELLGAAQGRMAVLLVLSSPDLVYHAHLMVTDVALFAGFAVGLYGLALARRDRRGGGLFLGFGIGMGFLAKGLLAPGVLGITALLLPLVAQDWRRRDYVTTLFVAGLVALPWLLIWPCALYQRSPDLFKVLLWDNNFGRYLGFARLGAERTD